MDLQRADGTSVQRVLAQPRRLALLVYLATGRHAGLSRRDRITLLFWPDSDTDRARNALSRAVHVLRRELGADVLVSRGDEELGVNPDLLRCDVAAFEADLSSGRLSEALGRYRGPFLDGFHTTEAPDFEQWVDRTRAQLAERASHAAWTLAQDEASGLGEAERARLVHRALALADGSETDLQRGLRLLDRLGDRLGALTLAARYEAKLREEFGVPLSVESRALVAAVRAREPQVTESAAIEAAPPPIRPVVTAPAPAGTAAGRTTGSRRSLLLAAAFLGLVAAAVGLTRGPVPLDDHLLVIARSR